MTAAWAGAALACAAGLLVWAGASFLIRHAGRLVKMDLPDARRLHRAPTPRGGGLGIPVAVTLAAVAWILVFAADRRDVLLCVLVLALPNGVLGVIDDYRPIRSRVKFAIQALLAVGFVALGPAVETLSFPGLGAVDLGLAAYPFTVLWLIWASNVYNFMDGMDGLAAGSGVAFFATVAALAWLGPPAGSAAAWVAAFGAAACCGFLVVNYPPARIFMGDGGALYVGALLGGLAVVLAAPGGGGGLPFGALVLAMGSFMWDATYTLLMRIVRREDWLHPHKRHLFQRLVTSGWSHSRVRRLYALLALVGSLAALGLALLDGPLAMASLLVALAAFGCTSWVTERAERNAHDA